MDIKKMISSFSTSDLIVVGVVFVLLFVILPLMLFLNKKSQKTTSATRKLKKAKKDQFYKSLYAVLAKNKLLRNYIVAMTKRFGVMSVFTRNEIHIGVAKYAIKLFYYTVIATIVSCFIFDDIMSVFICISLAYVYYSITIERNLQRTVLQVYKDLKNAIISIRLEYKKSYDVAVALENATYGNRIAPIMEDLKGVLASTNGNEALTAFYEKVPFKQIQTLAMICYNINNTGDDIDENNNSVFDESMLVMNSDINQKIEEYDYEALKFGKLENLALIGIVMTIIIKYLLSKMLPSAAVLYNSVIGLLIMYGVLFYSIYAYRGVAKAHIKDIMSTDDRNRVVMRLLKNKKIEKFIQTIGPKNREKRILKANLKRAFSKRTVDDFVGEKYLYATVVSIFLLIAIFITPIVEKNYLENYIGGYDLTSSIKYTDDKGNERWTKEEILKMDREYYIQRESGILAEPGTGAVVEESETGKEKLQKDETTVAVENFINKHMYKNSRTKLTTMELSDQVTRVEAKYQKLKSAKFHWWYIFIVFVGAIVAYKMPDKGLKKRIKLAKDEEEEEFLQLQVIMMILASMNFDTLETLGHLAQIADIHKEMLLYCYYGYASNPEKELNKMIKQTQSENFKQFITKLKTTIEDLSIKEAFADLRADREHICNERAVYIKETIERKRRAAGQLALRPMQLAVYGMLVFPLIYTGITGLMETMSQIGSM